MTDATIRAALEDMAAGCPVSDDKAAGIRAALRVVCAHLDAAAARVAPAGKRTNPVDRHTADVLRSWSDRFDEWRQATYAAAVEAAAKEAGE